MSQLSNYTYDEIFIGQTATYSKQIDDKDIQLFAAVSGDVNPVHLAGQYNVSYPMAKETGDLASYFNVKGIPAAAVVKGGKIIWRGHPQRLNDEMLAGWM